MKKYKLLAILALTCTCFLSCNDDFLDIFPGNQLSEPTFWKTESDAKLALAGCYNGWESHYVLQYADAYSDNGYSQFAWRGVQYMGNGIVDANTSSGNYRAIIYYSYSAIRRYNYFLENIDNVDMDASKKDIYKAEVRFLRAYDYYRKVMFFGDVSLVTSTINNPEDAKLPRDSKDIVIDFILEELEEIADILPEISVKDARGHVTAGAALALKARLELFEGKYADAIVSSKKVIDMGLYDLYPNFKELFHPENEENQEVILDIQYVKNDLSEQIMFDILGSTEGGNNGISSTHSLVEAFECSDGLTTDLSPLFDPIQPFKNRDPRLAMTVLYSGLEYNGRFYNTVNRLLPDGLSNPEFADANIAPRTGYGINKYNKPVPAAERQNGGSNWIVIRLAEVYLTFAEASVEANQINDEVYDVLDEIRVRAGMPPVDRTVYSSQQTLRELVRRERRVEFAWEGFRYWDIKRWDIGADVMPGPLYGSYRGTLNLTTGEVTWDFDQQIVVETRNFFPERNYLFPLSQGEIDANPNSLQNPGY